MPRSLIAAAVCSAALALVPSGALAFSPLLPPPTVPSPPARPPDPGTPAPVDWRLDQAGRDPLSLDLTAFGSSSCLPGSVGATVVESPTRIRVTVAAAPSTQPCTADYAPVPLTVRLAQPVRGRAVVGPRRLPLTTRTSTPPIGAPPDGDLHRVPRVTGLAPADAVAVVRLYELRPAVEHVADLRSRPRVIGQTPASGRRASARAVVTLFVSR